MKKYKLLSLLVAIALIVGSASFAVAGSVCGSSCTSGSGDKAENESVEADI